MAVKKACIIGNSVMNTGKECNIAMGPTAMIIPVPAALTFTIAELQDIIAWALPLMHAAPALRIRPLFGQKAPINTITNNADADVIVTLDDGTPVYIRPGIYSRIYETIAGGLCYAKELQSFLNSGMNIIEVDKTGQGLICNTNTVNEDGDKLYRGLIPNFMYGPSPILADLKTTPYKNRFSYSFDPTEMVNNGEIFTGFSPLLAVMGLIDTDLIDNGTLQSITHIKFGVQTECAETDLVEQLGVDLTTHVSNFSVFDVTADAAITPSGATETSGEVDLTGVYPTGHVIRVTGATPAAWLANEISGYDASGSSILLTIP